MNQPKHKSSTLAYRVYQLRDPDSAGTTDLVRAVRESVVPSLRAEHGTEHGSEHGAQIFGLFEGRLGLSSNEVYLVTSGENEQGDIAAALGDFEIVQQVDLVPTVRPLDHTPREKPGVYVFRWFKVFNRDVEEIVELSNKAWNTFEGGFDTQVQGLFAEPDRSSERGRMLLITWYRNLSVWEDSRMPPDEARRLFIKRHALTLQATPIATRLVKVD